MPTLRVVEGRCPNLLAEAGLYCHGDANEHNAEIPVDEHNHALAALRYLVSRLDARQMAVGAKAPVHIVPTLQRLMDWDDERYWTGLN